MAIMLATCTAPLYGKAVSRGVKAYADKLLKKRIALLCDAARNGNIAIVRQLIRIINPNVRCADHCTPLHYAAQNDRFEIAFTLLTHGAFLDTRTLDGSTPLHHALSMQNTVVAEFLATLDTLRITAHAYDIKGRTPFHWAAYHGDTKTIRAFLNNGVNPTIQDPSGNTALCYAAQNGHTDTVFALIQGGADITAQNPHQDTALHAAAARGHASVVALLLKQGIDANVHNLAGKTAYDLAQDYKQHAALDVLEEFGY